MLYQTDFGAEFRGAWAEVLRFLPQLLAFLLILLIGWLIAKALAGILDKVLERVGFDRLVERGGVGRALARSDYDASGLLAKVVFYAAMLFVLQLAFGVFGPNPISDLITDVISYLPKVFAAILIIVVAAAIAAAVREIVDAALGNLSYGRALANVAGVLILGTGIFAALVQLEIAPEVVLGLYYAMLAIIAGSAIIAIGGGGIAPMREVWNRSMNRIRAEAPEMKREMEGASDRVADRAEQRRQELGPEEPVVTPREQAPPPAEPGPPYTDGY